MPLMVFILFFDLNGFFDFLTTDFPITDKLFMEFLFSFYSKYKFSIKEKKSFGLKNVLFFIIKGKFKYNRLIKKDKKERMNENGRINDGNG